MTLTVTHAKVDAIPDNAADAAAGKVLPSDWNADHVVTGTADANLEVDATTISSGTAQSVLFESSSNKLGEDARFFYDPTGQGHLFIGSSDPVTDFKWAVLNFGDQYPALGILGGSGNDNTFAVEFIGQHAQGLNIGLKYSLSSATAWNMWVATPGTLPAPFDSKIYMGVNYVISDTVCPSPFLLDPDTVVWFNGTAGFADWNTTPGTPVKQVLLSALPDKLIITPLVSNDSSALGLDATSIGGDNIAIFSTGTGSNYGAGVIGIYDLTLGSFGTAAMLLKAGTFVKIGANTTIVWNSDPQYLLGTDDTGISRISPAVVGVGNGTAGDVSGTLQCVGITSATHTFKVGTDVVWDINVVSGSNTFTHHNHVTINFLASVGQSPTLLFREESNSTQFGIFENGDAGSMLLAQNGRELYFDPQTSSAKAFAAGDGANLSQSLVIQAYAVGSLPAAPVAGQLATVNDALVPVVGNTVGAGGAAFAMVCYNGAAWKVFVI